MPFRQPLVGLSQTQDVVVGNATKASEYNNLRFDSLRALTSLDEEEQLLIGSLTQRNHMVYSTDTDEIYFAWDDVLLDTPQGIAAWNCRIRESGINSSGERFAFGNNIGFGGAQVSRFDVSHNSSSGLLGITTSLDSAAYFHSLFKPFGIGSISQFAIGGRITTGGLTNSISLAATLHVSEPNIIVSGGDTISNAASVYIHAAPTEANNNYALFINSGISRFGGIIQLPSLDNGAGLGRQIQLGRNTDAVTPAGGTIRFTDRGNTSYYVWADDSGDLRIGTTGPTSGQDTSGTVVGDQSSWHEIKHDIIDWDGRGALEAIVDMPLYSFSLNEDGRREGKKMHGVVIHEETRDSWFSMNAKDNQMPCLDSANVQGHLLGAVKELKMQLDETREELRKLREGVSWFRRVMWWLGL